MKTTLLKTGEIQIDDERYAPWPNFRPKGVKTLRGQWSPRYLSRLITEDDLFCWSWRRAIPVEVRRELLRYTDHHVELLELAKLDPTQFVRLSQSNPALTLLIAIYWVFPNWRRMPAREERDKERTRLLSLKRREQLARLGFQKRNEWVRLLGKIPPICCLVFHLSNVLNLCRDSAIRRKLRHLSAITFEVSWLFRQRDLMPDMALLELAIREPHHSGLTLLHLVGSIAAKRQRACLKPTWPYQGTVNSWVSLKQAELRTAMRCSEFSDQLPPPPISTECLPVGLCIAPLTSQYRVIEEARKMNNCILQYEESIRLGERYLYRMVAPERATVMLRRVGCEWIIQEAGRPNNEGKISETTRQLLARWMRDHQHPEN